MQQTILNYRLRSTHGRSIRTAILCMLGREATIVYLIWTRKLEITSVAYALFVNTVFLMGYQIKCYERNKGRHQSAAMKSKYSLLMKVHEFLRNYILLLIWSIINGLVYYYLFEFTKSNIWIPKLIGAITSMITDSMRFIPEIVLIIRTKSIIGYRLGFIIVEMIGSLFGILTVCLQSKIDIVPLISFVVLLVFQLVILVLKLYAFLHKDVRLKKIWSKQQKDSSSFGECFVE